MAKFLGKKTNFFLFIIQLGAFLLYSDKFCEKRQMNRVVFNFFFFINNNKEEDIKIDKYKNLDDISLVGKL